MSFFNEYNQELTGVVFEGPLDDILGGGGTKTPTPSPTPRQLQSYGKEDLRQLWRADRISDDQWKTELMARGLTAQQAADEIATQKGVGVSTDAKTRGQLTASETTAVNALKGSLPASKPDIDSWENPALAAKGISTISGEPSSSGAPLPSRTASSSGAGMGGGGSSPSAQAAPRTAGTLVDNNGRPYLEYQGQKYMLPQNATPDQIEAVQRRLASGDVSGAVQGNTRNDLYLRGGTDLGKAIVQNGAQWRASGVVPSQGADGKWYIPGQATPFPSEAAAKAATPLVNAGAGLTSRFGNSPTAKAAAQGGYSKVIDPAQANFDLIGMDQSIAAGATPGMQKGEILGTVNRKGYAPMDITVGGVSQGGGMTLATPGDYAMTQGGYTGQLPGNVAIGMSSINNAGQGNYALSQSLGVPQSMIEALKLTPQEMAQLDQYQSTLRNNGQLPNFASLYAKNEPTGYQGAAGGSRLIVGSQNGGASNTEFDQAWNPFLQQALGSPDLAYLPDNYVAPGQSGGQQPDNWWLDDAYAMKDGGQFWTNEPIVGIGMYSKKPRYLFGEEAPEKVTVEPADVALGRERGMGAGMGGVKKMAGGGSFTARNVRDTSADPKAGLYNADGSATDYGVKLGYEGSPYTPGPKDLDVLQDSGSSYRYVMNPQQSRTGQPVPASFDRMPLSEQERFNTQGNAMPNEVVRGPLTPTGAMQPYGNDVLPVYRQSQAPDYSGSLGTPIGYKQVPMKLGSTPVLVEVPQYNTGPQISRDQRKSNQVNYIMSLLGGGNAGEGAATGLSRADLANASPAQLVAMLYDIDPKAAAIAAMQYGGGQGAGMGQGMGGRGSGDLTDPQIAQDAARRRFYDTNARNYGRSGVPNPTIADIPRQVWNGEGPAPWGNGPAPYADFNGQLGNGYITPFDYFGPNATGGNQGGRMNNRTGWMNQGAGMGGEWWKRKGTRPQNPALGAGLTGMGMAA